MMTAMGANPAHDELSRAANPATFGTGQDQGGTIDRTEMDGLSLFVLAWSCICFHCSSKRVMVEFLKQSPWVAATMRRAWFFD
jgi:hypothetical protein